MLVIVVLLGVIKKATENLCGREDAWNPLIHSHLLLVIMRLDPNVTSSTRGSRSTPEQLGEVSWYRILRNDSRQPRCLEGTTDLVCFVQKVTWEPIAKSPEESFPHPEMV